MRKTLLVLRNEIIVTVKNRSFLLIAVGLPLLLMAVTLVVWFIRRQDMVSVTEAVHPQATQIEGIVDESGIIKRLPRDVPAERLVLFDNEDAAKQALAQGRIEAYYIVSDDYLASGTLYYVRPDANMTTSARTAGVVEWTLLYNMLDGDLERAARLWSPMRLTATPLAPAQATPIDDELFMLPYFIVLAFYIVVIMSGSLLRSSMGEERKNRVQEILLTTLNPVHLLLGKIAGLGIVGLLQMLFWASMGYVSLRIMGAASILPVGFQIAPALIAWTGVFFLLGYAVYGSLLAGVGALTGPNTPGSSSSDFAVVWPTLAPMLAWPIITEHPHDMLAVVLSLFPLTSPVAMLMRLVMGGVPAWQIVLATVLLAATAYLVICAVAAMFRAQNLLTGQPFSLGSYITMLLGRA